MRTFLSITVLHIAAVCASAADQPGVINVSRAFSPYVKSEQWGQVTARLRNPTDRAVQVRFVYPGGKIDYTRIVNLPGMTHRTIRLGQRVGPIEIDKTRSSTKKLIPHEQAFRLEDAQTNKILDSDFMLVSALAPTQCCLAYIDPEDPPGQGHAYLLKIPDSPFGNVALVSSRQQYLPDKWYGYSLLKILVLSSTEPAELSDGQIGAILDWVGRGGVLVVTAHSVADRTLAGPMSEAAGVVVSGAHQEYRLEASSLTAVAGLPPGGADGSGRFQVEMKTPMVMAHLCPMDADVLWEGNGMPLLTLRRHGAGAVFTLALPVGALATDQTGPLWKTIARQMERVQSVSPESFAAIPGDKLTQFASRLAGRRSRDRRTPACIIGAQAAMFLLLGLFLHLRRRGELAWVAMIPLGLLGGVGLMIWGMTFRDEPRVSFLSLASVRPDGRTHIQQLSTYYTPETENIDFSSGSPLGTIRPVASDTTSVMETVKVAGKRTMVLEGVRIIANSSRSAYAEAPANLPGRLVAEVRLGPKGLEGTITNNTGEDLFDAIVVTGGAAYTVGLLPA